MKISELQHGQVVTYRLGRGGRTGVDWEPWQEGPLHVVRRQKDIKHGKTFYRAGDIMGICPQNGATAEFREEIGGYSRPDEHHPFGVFVAEDYYMEIEGLQA